MIPGNLLLGIGRSEQSLCEILTNHISTESLRASQHSRPAPVDVACAPEKENDVIQQF